LSQSRPHWLEHLTLPLHLPAMWIVIGMQGAGADIGEHHNQVATLVE